jgi:hypothetical protein
VKPSTELHIVIVQDNFVSYTMHAAEQSNQDRIAEQKSRCEILTPLEPLVVGLVKGFIDDADLSRKLSTLYTVVLQYWSIYSGTLEPGSWRSTAGSQPHYHQHSSNCFQIPLHH